MRVSVTSRTAVYGPVRTVVWEGWSRKAPPYPDLWRKADIRQARISAKCQKQCQKQTSMGGRIRIITRSRQYGARFSSIRHGPADARLGEGGLADPPQTASVQLSENANADVENGCPSRSRGQDRPCAS